MRTLTLTHTQAHPEHGRRQEAALLKPTLASTSTDVDVDVDVDVAVSVQH